RDKLVEVLGSHGRLPVEVLPFALPLCRRRLEALGLKPVLRTEEDRPFVTDNWNVIVDCATGPIEDPHALERTILTIPGDVDTGLFLGIADSVLVADGVTVRELDRRRRPRATTRPSSGSPPSSRPPSTRRPPTGRAPARRRASGLATPRCGPAPARRPGWAGWTWSTTSWRASTGFGGWPRKSAAPASGKRSCSAWAARASAPTCCERPSAGSAGIRSCSCSTRPTPRRSARGRSSRAR